MKPALAIVGCGAVTAVGFTAAQTCAAVRTAITGFTRTLNQDVTRGPTLQAVVPIRPHPAEANQFGRLVALATMALQECVVSADVQPDDCVLFLAVREPFRMGADTNWRDLTLLDAIQAGSRTRFHRASEVIAEGNAGVFLALARARAHLDSGYASTCIVGGVDSLLNGDDKKRLGASYRLKSDAVAQGMVPGEGAAFVALSRQPARSTLGVVVGFSVAREEPATSASGSLQPLGEGLENAMRGALMDAGLDESDVAFRVSDMNGETYRGHENMLAVSRVFRTRRERFPQILPASCVGEIGSAAGPLQMIVAATAFNRGYAPGPVAMCEASSDGGLRGACVLAGSQLSDHGA